MEWWTDMGNGNGAMAWTMAFLLALGGTALVLAVWLRLRRSWPGHITTKAVLRALLGVRTRTADTPADGPPEPPRKPAQAPPRQAVQAYRSHASSPGAGDGPELTPEALSAYLRRLHKAVDSLEAAATEVAARG